MVLGLQEYKAVTISKVVSPTHRPPLPPGDRSQGHSADGKIKSIKDPNDSIGNQTHELPACSGMFNQLHH